MTTTATGNLRIPLPSDASRRSLELGDRKPTVVKEFLYLHCILTEIVEQQLGQLPFAPPSGEDLLLNEENSNPCGKVPEPQQKWLELLDMAVAPHLLRRYILEHDSTEQNLQLLIRFLVAKKKHSPADIEKVEWLLTHLFRTREERCQLVGGWYRNEIQELLGDTDPKPLTRSMEDLLSEFPPMLEEVKDLSKFSQITDSRIIDRGRDLKSRFGEGFFHPIVLAAIVNYNLLLEKKFQRLFLEAVQQLPPTSQLKEAIMAAPDDVLQTDYRRNSNAFWELGKQEKESTGRVKEFRAAPVSANASTMSPETAEERMNRMGIDSGRHAERLRARIRDMGERFQTNHTITSVPMGAGTMLLADWELNALRNNYSESGEDFRAQLARNISYAVGIVSRVQEELPAYYETKGIDHLWKPHCESLLFLLHEGRRRKSALDVLAADSNKRGLFDKAKQIAQTKARLESALEKIESLNEPNWLRERLP